MCLFCTVTEAHSANLQIDRLFDWKAQTDAPIQQSLKSQKEHVKREFDERLKQSVLNLNEQGLNVALYWNNPDKRKYVNVVPTSAITGEGLPDMLQLLVDLTQVRLHMLGCMPAFKRPQWGLPACFVLSASVADLCVFCVHQGLMSACFVLYARLLSVCCAYTNCSRLSSGLRTCLSVALCFHSLHINSALKGP